MKGLDFFLEHLDLFICTLLMILIFTWVIMDNDNREDEL